MIGQLLGLGLGGGLGLLLGLALGFRAAFGLLAALGLGFAFGGGGLFALLRLLHRLARDEDLLFLGELERFTLEIVGGAAGVGDALVRRHAELARDDRQLLGDLA